MQMPRITNKMLDQARLDWVTKNLKVTHYLQELAARGDATASGLRRHILERAHLTETQLSFARRHIRDLVPGADLDESTSVIRELA